MQPIFSCPHWRAMGRFAEEPARRADVLPLFWAASGAELLFTGEELSFFLEADFQRWEPWIVLELNGAPLLRMPLDRGVSRVCLFRGMASGPVKHVRLWKETQPMAEDERHSLRLVGLEGRGGAFLPLPERRWRLEFVGDSLTSGEGLAGGLGETDWVPALFSASASWARRTADLLGADFRTVSQSGWGVRTGWDGDARHALPAIYETVCAPAAADASLGSQLPCDFGAWPPDAVIVNLGTNDAGAIQRLGLPQGERLLEAAAVRFLERLRQLAPRAKLVWAYGMLGDDLRPVLERAAEKVPGAYYLPLPPVTEETMGSRQHPGPLCHQAAAETAAAFLRGIL